MSIESEFDSVTFNTPPFHLMGWVDAPERHEVAKAFPPLSEVAAHLFTAPPTGDVLLYKAWKQATGSYVPYPAQAIGDCESFGHAHGNDLLQCVEALILDPNAKLKQADFETDTEFLYGAGREAGNMLGWQDGCFGSAMVKAMTTIGAVPRFAVGAYSGNRAKQWGHDGPPADLKTKAASFKLGGAAMAKTWDDLVAAIGNGYPVTVSSDQGFTMTRDADGFCSPHGSWGHCMLICGVRQGSRPGACIFQSWGPDVPSGPLALDQPDNTFWADKDVVSSMLAGQDSFALSAAPFFVARPIPANWVNTGWI